MDQMRSNRVSRTVDAVVTSFY